MKLNSEFLRFKIIYIIGSFSNPLWIAKNAFELVSDIVAKYLSL